MTFRQRINYLGRSLLNITQEKACPFCGGKKFTLVDKKYGVTSLLKCQHCGLNHRHPKDDEARLKQFYQSEYHSDIRMMTKLPSDDELKHLKEKNFPSFRGYDKYLNALSLKTSSRVLDYGCSWGYDVFKLGNAGFDTIGYELSKPRAEFGRKKLEVEIHSTAEEVRFNNDLILSSHVIEHLASIPAFVDFAKKHLTDDGVFMILCPNGSKDYFNRDPQSFHVNWGELHPNYLDIDFAAFMFRENPYLVLTGDWEFDVGEIAQWDRKTQRIGSRRDGKELMIISKPNQKIS